MAEWDDRGCLEIGVGALVRDEGGALAVVAEVDRSREPTMARVQRVSRRTWRVQEEVGTWEPVERLQLCPPRPPWPNAFETGGWCGSVIRSSESEALVRFDDGERVLELRWLRSRGEWELDTYEHFHIELLDEAAYWVERELASPPGQASPDLRTGAPEKAETQAWVSESQAWIRKHCAAVPPDEQPAFDHGYGVGVIEGFRLVVDRLQRKGALGPLADELQRMAREQVQRMEVLGILPDELELDGKG